jgi:hypothetical protein
MWTLPQSNARESKQGASMSKHDEDLLQLRNKQLVQALKNVCAIVEAIPEADRVRLGLYSMPTFNIAYRLIAREDDR